MSSELPNQEQPKSVNGTALVLLVVAGTLIVTLAWSGLLLIRCHDGFEWLVRSDECHMASVLVPALTVPALILGSVLAWKAQAWRFFWLGTAVTLVPLAAFPIAPYGFGEHRVGSLEEQVEDAMKRFPRYDYVFLPARDARGYIVFRVEDREAGVKMRIAYGGNRESSDSRGVCGLAPEVPLNHPRRSKPFAAAGPEPLICFESYYPRRISEPENKAAARINIGHLVANALCEELYGPWTCFF